MRSQPDLIPDCQSGPSVTDVCLHENCVILIWFKAQPRLFLVDGEGKRWRYCGTCYLQISRKSGLGLILLFRRKTGNAETVQMGRLSHDSDVPNSEFVLTTVVLSSIGAKRDEPNAGHFTVSPIRGIESLLSLGSCHCHFV